MRELRPIEYFVAIADTGSFSRAATQLGISQPVLSRQIRLLEDEMRTQLFFRNGRGVVLTKSGTLFLEFARITTSLAKQVQRDIFSLDDAPSGTVTVGVVPSFCTMFVGRLVTAAAERYPDIKINIREGMSGTIIDWLQLGCIDIGTVYNTGQFGPLNAEPFFTEQLFVARAWSPELGAVPVITGKELAQLPLALPNPNHGLRWLLTQKIERSNLELDVRFEVDSVHAIKQLIINTGVASILPYGAIAMEVENCAISATALIKPTIHRTMAMATASSHVDRSTKLIAALMKEVVNSTLDLPRWQHVDVRRQARAA